MDKLTLTRQFGIQIRDFPWEVSGRIWNGIISIHTEEKVLYWFKRWGRDRGRGKNRRFHIVLFCFWSKNQSDLFRTFRLMRKWVRFYRIKPMGLKEWYKKKRGKKKLILNKNEVEEPRFQMNKFKLEKDLSDSRKIRGKGIDRERFLVLIIRSWFDPHMFGKKNNLPLWS